MNGYYFQMTPDQLIPHSETGTPTAGDRFVDLTAVATEPTAKSIVHENEIVEHIAHEPLHPGDPEDHSADDQLAALVDPDEIRQH